jgi:hypothetical protein
VVELVEAVSLVELVEAVSVVELVEAVSVVELVETHVDARHRRPADTHTSLAFLTWQPARSAGRGSARGDDCCEPSDVISPE